MTSRAMLIGAAAGTIAALAFTILHGVMINTIWFMLVPMLVAGALCGTLLGWSYSLLNDKHTIAGWLRYNVLYLALLFLLGPVSLLVLEPMITIPELVTSPNGLPADLVRAMTPLVTAYTIVMSVIITLLAGRRWSAYFAVLATSAALMLLLGLNIAALGLVYLTNGWLPMMLELLALILTLNFVYAAAFVILGHNWLWKSRSKNSLDLSLP
jgi:hypothetical protein